VTEREHERVMHLMSEIISAEAWDRLREVIHEDAVYEFPQSGERFRGLAQIRAQFERHPDMSPESSKLTEVVGEETYALTASYTVIRVDDAGQKGTSVVRVRYGDGSWWWIINLYEFRDGRITRNRSYFAADFPAPDYRAAFREAP
jgi:ketosteroid isomerase-like protein